MAQIGRSIACSVSRILLGLFTADGWLTIEYWITPRHLFFIFSE